MQANLLHQTLVASKQLILKPENWTQYCRARDKEGVSVRAVSESATSFCLIGAIEKVVGTIKCKQVIHEVENLWREGFNAWPMDYNDAHSHSDVIARLEELIELTKEEITQ